ncbi:helix-turn-helix transcriptional regulator [Paraliobacillus ryukyuensis]|uniref:helix-turn-helix transcriptional regulator n=1 Tax=Paraliobacillus ryukyuensis TaxID=200904 RepID=UPI000DEBAE75
MFQNKEGQLYTLLHLLENKELITSEWKSEKKYYSLMKKGVKYLAAYKQAGSNNPMFLKHLLEEVSL